MAKSARAQVEAGFTAVRLYPVSLRDVLAKQGFSKTVRTVERYVAAVREAVGDEIDVALDVICQLTPPEAIAVGQALAPYHLYFFEDPIEPDNIDIMAQVAARLPMPVATGERLCTLYQFHELLRRNGAAFVRPDLGLAGGITQVRKIAALAEATYVGVIPHCPLSWVVTTASVHVCVAIHNAPILEFHHQGNDFHPPSDELFLDTLPLQRGYLPLPDRPGLGIELNDEALPHYPPVSGQRPAIIARDGGLRDY